MNQENLLNKYYLRKSAFNNHQDMMGILPSGVASSTTSNGVKAVVNGTSSQTGSGTTQVQTNSGSSSAPNDNTRTVIKRKG